MKKYNAILFSLLLVACGGAEEQNENEEIVEENLVDTVQVDTLVEVVEEEMNYNYFEDYAQFATKEEIYEAFGEANLTDATEWYAEGTVQLECTRLKNPDNGHEIKFVFDEENPEKLSSIEARYYTSEGDSENRVTQKIETKCGTYTGMTFNELRDWNEEEFEFSGFGWDFGGGIMPSTGSKIEQCKVMMMLDYDYNDSDQELFTSLLGDQIFKSDNENAVKAPIFIGFLTYYLPQ